MKNKAVLILLKKSLQAMNIQIMGLLKIKRKKKKPKLTNMTQVYTKI